MTKYANYDVETIKDPVRIDEIYRNYGLYVKLKGNYEPQEAKLRTDSGEERDMKISKSGDTTTLSRSDYDSNRGVIYIDDIIRIQLKGDN